MDRFLFDHVTYGVDANCWWRWVWMRDATLSTNRAAKKSVNHGTFAQTALPYNHQVEFESSL